MKPNLAVVTHIKVTAHRVNNHCARLWIVIRKPASIVTPSYPFRRVRRLYYGYAAFLIVLALSLPSSARATSIVIHKTATDIFASADSKEVHPGEADTMVNKIVSVKGNWYVAAAGKLEINVGVLANFNVFQSAQMCSLVAPSFNLVGLNSPTMREFADSCSSQIARELYSPLRAVKQDNPALYATYIANQVVLELVFFGAENGQLKEYIRDIFPDPLLDGFTHIKPTDCEGQCTGNIALGYYDVIAQVLAQNSDYWKTDQEKAICGLIALEINKHPDVVGWPVKVLHLSVGGTVEWFTHENGCEEKKAPTKAIPKPKPTRRPRRRTRARSR
jgi:hypothetical protein